MYLPDDEEDEDAAPAQKEQDQALAFRSCVASVVAELRSQALRTTYSGITLAEVVDQQIAALTGDDGPAPSRKKRLTALYENFSGNFAALLATDPALFRTADPEEDVNTKP